MENNHYEPSSNDVYADDLTEELRQRPAPPPHGAHRPPSRQGRRTAALAILTILALLAALIFGGLYAGAQSNIKKAAAANQSQVSELTQQLTQAQSSISHYQEELGIPGGEPDTEGMDSSQLASTLQQQLDHLNSKTNDLRSQINALKPPVSVPASTDDHDDGRKVAYLTFDDGPSDNTSQILDILKQYNAKATFFVIGSSKLNMTKRIADEGHTVALHSDSHDYKKIYSSETAYFEDLKAISDKVQNHIGTAPKVIRFPGGSSNTVSKKHCKGIMSALVKSVEQQGYVYFDWNADSGDASGNNVDPAKLVANVKRECGGKSRICLLMHDAPAKSTTVTALPEIIQYLQSEGYSLEALTTDVKPFHHGVQN